MNGTEFGDTVIVDGPVMSYITKILNNNIYIVMVVNFVQLRSISLNSKTFDRVRHKG